MPEPPTSTWKDDPVTLLGLGVLDGAVDSYSLDRAKSVIDEVTNESWVIISRTAQRTEAASALGNPSGMGVTSEEN